MEGMAEALRIPSPTPSMVSVSDGDTYVDPDVIFEVEKRVQAVEEAHQDRLRALVVRYGFLQSLEYMRRHNVGEGWDDDSSEEEGEVQEE